MVSLLDLPTEILIEIVSYFAEVWGVNRARPPETKLREFEQLQYLWGTRHWPDWTTLSKLRLTCRLLSKLASDALFGGYFVCLDTYPLGSPKGSLQLMTDLIASRSEANCSIKKLLIDIEDHQFFETSPGLVELEDEAIERDKYIDNIPLVLAALPKLEVLRIITKGWFCNEADVSVQIKLARAEQFIQALATGLSTPGLASISSLHLQLLCARDFEVLSVRLPGTFFEHIRNLYIAISDGTGPDGDDDHYYTGQYDSYYDGDEHCLYSNLQSIYPNLAHQKGVFDMVSKCKRLVSLAICGTQFLDGDLLNWPANSNTLETLYLNRIEISAQHLVHILSPGSCQSGRQYKLSRLQCSQVQLKSGTWDQVFQHLEGLPSLRYFCSRSLDYSFEGESAMYRAYTAKVWSGETEHVLTVRADDMVALRRLWKTLYEKKNPPRPNSDLTI